MKPSNLINNVSGASYGGGIRNTSCYPFFDELLECTHLKGITTPTDKYP